MDVLKTFCRIGLGLLLIASGVGLLFNRNSARSLPGHLEALGKVFVVAKYLVPFSTIYYNLNAGLFAISGLFALINLPFAQNFYLIAAIMFGATYDNPMLSPNSSARYLRYTFILCHLCIYCCLCALSGQDTEEERQKPKTERVEAEKKQESKGEEEVDNKR